MSFAHIGFHLLFIFVANSNYIPIMFIKSYINTLKLSFNYSGRTTRKDFWIFNTVTFFIVFAWLFCRIYFKFSGYVDQIDSVFFAVMALLAIPSMAVAARRLHDVSKSGWFLLANFVPIIGQVILLVFFTTDSVPSYNDYGEYPKFKLNEF